MITSSYRNAVSLLKSWSAIFKVTKDLYKPSGLVFLYKHNKWNITKVRHVSWSSNYKEDLENSLFWCSVQCWTRLFCVWNSKATEQYFLVVLFIVLYKVVLTAESEWFFLFFFFMKRGTADLMDAQYTDLFSFPCSLISGDSCQHCTGLLSTHHWNASVRPHI